MPRLVGFPCSIDRRGAWLQIECGHLNTSSACRIGASPFLCFSMVQPHVAQPSTDMAYMTPSQIQTELNKMAAALSGLRKEITASEFQSRTDPRKVSEVESKLAAAEQSCRKCACLAGELVGTGAQQTHLPPSRK
jgi:hypothetical protein